MVVILVAPLLMARLRLPGIVGYILAGVVLGPNALGVLARDQAVILLGTVGLLYIMFTAAMEIDLASFRRYRVQSLVFGSLSYLIPQTVGAVVAYYLLGFEVAAAVLLASMFGSHTLLGYPLASRLGIGKDPAVTVTVGGTMVTDTSALMVLAVVAGMSRGEVDEAFWLRLGLSIGLYVTLIFVGIPRLGRWFFRRFHGQGAAEFVFVLAVVFTTAALANTAGVVPIVGAFLAGLALNSLIPHHSALMNRLKFTGEAVFIPFFLLSVGMLVDPSVFFDGIWTWVVAIVMSLTVLFTKGLAAEIARLLFRYDVHQGRVMYGLSVAQAAATLAAVMVGYDIGLFDDAVVNGTIVMILVTCVVGPMLIERHGTALAISHDAQATNGDEMPQRILVAVANPTTAAGLLDLAMVLRDPVVGQPLYPLAVATSDDPERIAHAERLVSEALMHAASADVASQPLVRLDDDFAKAITLTRKERRITDVVVGWSGAAPGAHRRFGVHLDALVASGDVNLIVARLKEPLAVTERVVVLLPPRVDEEPEFLAGIACFKRVARNLGARLVIVTERLGAEYVSTAVSRARPRVPTEAWPLEQWEHLSQLLADRLEPSDLVCVYGVREGGIAWRHDLLALPYRLAARFEHANVGFLFPGRNGLTDETLEPPEVRPEDVLIAEEAAEPTSLPEALVRHALVRLGFEDTLNDRTLGTFLRSAEQVAPGVALMQSHAVDARGTVMRAVALGVSRTGLHLEGLDDEIHLLFVVAAIGGDTARVKARIRAEIDLLHLDAVRVGAAVGASGPDGVLRAVHLGSQLEVRAAAPDLPPEVG